MCTFAKVNMKLIYMHVSVNRPKHMVVNIIYASLLVFAAINICVSSAKITNSPCVEELTMSFMYNVY